MHSCSKVREWIFALIGMICGYWTNAGQQILSDYRIPRQIKRGMFFCLWQMHLVFLQRSRKMKPLRGLNMDNRIPCWKWNYIRIKFNFMQVNSGSSAQYLQLSGYLGPNEAPSGTGVTEQLDSSFVSMAFTVCHMTFDWEVRFTEWIDQLIVLMD